MVIYHPMDTNPQKNHETKIKIQEHVEWTKLTPLKTITQIPCKNAGWKIMFL